MGTTTTTTFHYSPTCISDCETTITSCIAENIYDPDLDSFKDCVLQKGHHSGPAQAEFLTGCGWCGNITDCDTFAEIQEVYQCWRFCASHTADQYCDDYVFTTTTTTTSRTTCLSAGTLTPITKCAALPSTPPRLRHLAMCFQTRPCSGSRATLAPTSSLQTQTLVTATRLL